MVACQLIQNSMDSLASISYRQGTHFWLLCQSVPVVGVVTSIPGVLVALVFSITTASRAAFNAIKARFHEPQANHQERQAELLQDASDWGLLFLNQLVNLCTAGILNNILVGVPVYRQCIE